MRVTDRPFLLSLTVAAGGLVGVLLPWKAPLPIRLLLPALMAGGTAGLVAASTAGAEPVRHEPGRDGAAGHSATPDIETPQAVSAADAEVLRLTGELAELRESQARLRHDLRGILSPALLIADRLAMSEEPVARRTAEMVIAMIERTEARISAAREEVA